MSNNGLRLYMQPDVPVSYIEEVLQVTFALPLDEEPLTDGSGQPLREAKLGRIEIYLNNAERLNQLPGWDEVEAQQNLRYKYIWSRAVTFRNSYAWNGVRNVLVLQLCQWLLNEYPGVYIGEFTDGSVFFYMDAESLVFDEEDREYLQHFPMPYGGREPVFGKLNL